MLQLKRIFSLILVLVLCLGLSVQVQASAIKKAKEKDKELKNQKNQTQEEKEALTQQLNEIVDDMEQTQKRLSAKEQEIKQKEEELVNAKIDENNQYESMKKRIVYMYENGNTEFIEILCNSKDIGEFLNKAEYISRISEYDRAQLVTFQNVVEEVKKQEEALQTEYTELTALREELGVKQASVEKLLADTNTKLEELEQKIGANAARLDKLLKEAAEAAARKKAAEEAAAKAAAQAAASAAAQQADGGAGVQAAGPPVVSGGGQFTNPCPGASYISSEFGEYRDTSDPSHKGMDFAAGAGVPTYAAADGTVVIANYSDSAGNWVVINHGNGLSTKYMHHSALTVSAGQRVTKGQQIGLVGSTGWSTGPHLHFQVEVNGMAVNPRNYL